MALGSFTESWISSTDFSNRYQLRVNKQTVKGNRVAGEIMKCVNTSIVDSKLDFLRSMGLEFTNCCDVNFNNNNNEGDNYNLQRSCKRSCRSSGRISEATSDSFDDIPEESFGYESRSRAKSSKNSQTRDMVGSQKIVPLLRECRVTIIGEKCKICGRSFKCIRDVQIHVKKKHRRKKPRKKLVLKIGNEVISRVPIKRKHLKWHHKEKHRTIDSSDDARSLWHEGELCSDQISDEEIAPFVDHDRSCEINEIRSRLMDSNKSDVLPLSSENASSLDHRIDEEEEIQVVLKITRPLKLMEINHETPNRTERERLITDAIREFIRMDEDLQVVEPASDLQGYRENNEIIEEYCRLAHNGLPIGNLDIEEHNCSFHIDNEDDTDCYNQDVTSLLPGNDDEDYNDETASIHSEHYRNENGDIIPDFIDYTRCLGDTTSSHINNNNVYELDSLFYNDANINEWNKGMYDKKPVGFDVHQNTNRSPDSSVIIKEEIMLDDLS